MTKRLVSASVIITMVVLIIYFDFQWGTDSSLGYAGIAMVPLVLVLSGMAAHELTAMVASRNPSTPQSMVILGAIVTVGCSCVPALWREYPLDCPVGRLGWNTLGLALAICITIVFEMIRFREAEKVIANLAYSVFAIVYTGFLMSFLPALRFYESNHVGMTALMSVLVVVKCSDAGAYFVGRAFGRTKLAPRMSPAKSVEGAIGAILTGVAISVAYFYWLAPAVSGGEVQPPVWASALFGAVVALTGMVGDLFESIIKRDFKAKDSSSWLPGLGGILDIFDSILAAAPAAYVLWVVGMLE